MRYANAAILAVVLTACGEQKAPVEKPPTGAPSVPVILINPLSCPRWDDDGRELKASMMKQDGTSVCYYGARATTPPGPTVKGRKKTLE